MGISIPIAMSVGGTLLQAQAQRSRGSAAQFAGQSKQIEDNFQATQLNEDAGQAIAVSQRNAADVDRKVSLINSAALARAAASGAGASDPSVIGTIARTSGEGAYRKGVALYEGEAQARMDRIRAASASLEGDLAVTQGNLAKKQSDSAAIATVLTGAANGYSMYSKYWSGPKTGTSNTGSLSFSNDM